MAYVASSVRNVPIYGGSPDIAYAAGSTGQTRAIAVVIRPKTADMTTPSGWTERLNIVQPDSNSRLVIITKALSGAESAGTLTPTFTGSWGTINAISWIDDGSFKRVASTTDSNWVNDNSTPSASTDANDTTAYAVVAAGQFPRTWSSGSLTVVGNTASSGGADCGMGYKTVTGPGTTGTLSMLIATAPTNDTEQTIRATLVFSSAAGGTTGDLIGSGDTPTLTSVALTGGPVSLAVGATADLTMTVLGGSNGTTPVYGVNAILQLSMPSGSATVTQLAVTDANGQATVRITGVTASAAGQSGTLTASVATKLSNQVTVVVTAAVGARSVRLDDLATTMAGGGATPTTGWTAWVFNVPAAADQIVGSQLFNAAGLTLVSNGSGQYRVDIPVPSSVTVNAGDSLRAILRRGTAVSSSVPTEEFGILAATVL